MLDRVEENSKSQTEDLSVQLQDKTGELTSLRLDNERLRVRNLNTETEE